MSKIERDIKMHMAILAIWQAIVLVVGLASLVGCAILLVGCGPLAQHATVEGERGSAEVIVEPDRVEARTMASATVVGIPVKATVVAVVDEARHIECLWVVVSAAGWDWEWSPAEQPPECEQD